MTDAIFMWIGVVFVGALALIGGIMLVGFLYYALIHKRFNFILFRKGERRISIASWYKYMWQGEMRAKADDWPVCERPFYASYRIGKRRLFILSGSIPDAPRSSVIEGTHPND